MALGNKRFWLRSATLLAVMLFAVLNLTLICTQPQKRELTENDIQTSSSEARQEGTWSWWVTRAFLMRPAAPDVVLLGSSQMGSATFSADAQTLHKDLDCTEYRKAVSLEQDLRTQTGCPVNVFNFAIGGEMVSDAYMIAHALFQGENKPKMVIIGVGPRDFMDNTLPSPSATEEFQFLSPYVDLGKLGPAAFTDPMSRFNWEINQALPLRRWSQSVLEALKPEAQPAQSARAQAAGTVHKDTLQAISGSSGDVRPGQWIIPVIKSSVFLDNTPEYRRRFASPNPPIYKPEKQFFSAFLSDMQDREIPVLVVGMPSQPPNRQLLPDSFWSDFRSFVSTECNKHGADWLDLTDSPLFITNYYLDTVHMKADGGYALFNLISRRIARQPNVVAALRYPRDTADKPQQLLNNDHGAKHPWF